MSLYRPIKLLRDSESQILEMHWKEQQKLQRVFHKHSRKIDTSHKMIVESYTKTSNLLSRSHQGSNGYISIIYPTHTRFLWPLLQESQLFIPQPHFFIQSVLKTIILHRQKRHKNIEDIGVIRQTQSYILSHSDDPVSSKHDPHKML